jgi:hypothetical protein
MGTTNESQRISEHSACNLMHGDVIDLTNSEARLDIGATAGQLRDPFDFSFDNFSTIRSARLV